jgi:mycothiol synthase
MVNAAFEILPCPLKSRNAALDILYQRIPEPLRDRLITQVQAEAAKGEIDLSGLWIAQKRTGRVIGALLTQALAGKAAAVWAPEVKSHWNRSTLAARLIQHALADLKGRGFRLAQAVLDDSTGQKAARDLTSGGMPRVTELLYLERETRSPLPTVHEHSSRHTSIAKDSAWTFEWQSFQHTKEHEFRSVLQATYTGTLDMPELEGARSLDDIIASHQATGRFNHEHWQLGRVLGRPEAASVLLLSQILERDAWEVVYLGLTPAARGRRLGRAVIARALELASPHVTRLELAVDCRNFPATRLYQSTGFITRDRRIVHLAILDQPFP